MYAKVGMGARYLLGLLFVVFGLNGFFNFIPMPPLSAEGGALLGAFAKSGYMFPLIKIVEISAGLAFLSNRFVPLGLVILTPILINIICFHIFLDMGGLPLALGLVVLHGIVTHQHWGAYSGVLKAKQD